MAVRKTTAAMAIVATLGAVGPVGAQRAGRRGVAMVPFGAGVVTLAGALGDGAEQFRVDGDPRFTAPLHRPGAAVALTIAIDRRILFRVAATGWRYRHRDAPVTESMTALLGGVQVRPLPGAALVLGGGIGTGWTGGTFGGTGAYRRGLAWSADVEWPFRVARRWTVGPDAALVHVRAPGNAEPGSERVWFVGIACHVVIAGAAH